MNMHLAVRKAPGQVAGVHFHLTLQTVLVLCALVLVVLAVYRVSLYFHPYTMCRRCGGSGKIAGWFPGSASFCSWCQGRGLRPRLGTLFVDGVGRAQAR